MSEFLANVKELRADLSDWLVHFTKGTDNQAEATLAKILSEAAIRSFGKPPAICFSEAPLGELNKLFQLFKRYPDPRFAPYGIAVSKTWLFERGGRPVIYGRAGEFHDLPPAYQYRHVTYHPPDFDFTWQREWRIATDQLSLDPASTIVIIPTEEDAFAFTCNVEVDAEYEGPGEVSVSYDITHDWHSLAIDQVAKQELHPDLLIAKSIREQELRKRER